MTRRLWYPQLDVYDCIRRMTALLSRSVDGMHPERLHILDFYFANAPLLHRTSMKADTRSAFRNLKIERPEKAFVTYPAAQLLFHQMEHIQRDGVGALAGKSLISIKDMQKRAIRLTGKGKSTFEDSIAENVSDDESALADFLVHYFGSPDEDGLRQLRASTGLRRAN